ncbi:uncharacterized protein [Haliotis cracherodii]|uniref:uncharacterized protein n=1 Tax=Haliotis cracherodii TaxID=6455 RepID=UPI0039E86F10
MVLVLETPMVHHECFDEEHPCLVCREPMTPDHRFYMTPLREENEEEEEGEGEKAEGVEEQHHLRDNVQYVFYDFECMHDTGEHIPNLCVVQLGCGRCISEVSKDLCEHCPWREEGRSPTKRKRRAAHARGQQPTWGKKENGIGTPSRKHASKRQRHAPPQQEAEEVEEVEGEEVMEVEKTKKPKNKNTTTHTVLKEDRIYVMAHNARSYDLHLILKGLSPLLVTLPTKIRQGQRILQMTLGRLCFEDSLNFIPYPLKAFPKSFGLKELKKELLAYCQSDVDILRRGCADFRQNAIHSVGMDPFVEVMTAAAFTINSFRKYDLKPNTIAILPPQGYQPKRNYSQAYMHWLHYLMETDHHLHLQHARNGGEKEFTCGEGQHRYSVDGYDPVTGTVYEFLGCFWHGCQACHKTQRGKPHPVLGTSLGARYTDTHNRLSLLSQHPEVKRIVTLWEHEFTKMQREDSALRAFLQGPHYSPCEHTDEERSWVGTYATVELQEAVKKYDYQVLQIYDVWHFDTFAQHDPDTEQEKLEACRYPEGCTDHDAYIQEIYDKEGIGLDKDRIEKNPGRRTIAKMQLNSLWGKFGQRVDYSQNVYMNDPVQYFALWMDERNTIEDVTVVNEHMVEVTYTQQKEFQTPHSHFNVAIAAWVTAQARLKLYETLALVDRRVLYFDTDSLIYIRRPHDELGHSLGEFTDNWTEKPSRRLCQEAPKTMAMS